MISGTSCVTLHHNVSIQSVSTVSSGQLHVNSQEMVSKHHWSCGHVVRAVSGRLEQVASHVCDKSGGFLALENQHRCCVVAKDLGLEF